MREARTAREKVWQALSELFLDTDVSDAVPYVRGVLMEAPFALEDLDRIFIDEVYPVCIWNLRQVAGEWAGFDREWLFERCAAMARRPGWRKALFRRLRRHNARRITPEWFDIREQLSARRS